MPRIIVGIAIAQILKAWGEVDAAAVEAGALKTRGVIQTMLVRVRNIEGKAMGLRFLKLNLETVVARGATGGLDSDAVIVGNTFGVYRVGQCSECCVLREQGMNIGCICPA